MHAKSRFDQSRMSRAGFTSGEVIIAVICLVIIAVSLSIIHHNSQYNDVPIRAKVARAQSDMRSLATALESFRAANGHYPNAIPVPANTRSGKQSTLRTWPYTTIDPGSGPDHPGLTTPVAYVTSLFLDPFSDAKPKTEYLYYNDNHGGWILISAGPDGDYDIDPRADYDSSNPERPWLRLVALTYDPSNGSASNGDVYRLAEPTAPQPKVSGQRPTIGNGYDPTNGTTNVGDFYRPNQ